MDSHCHLADQVFADDLEAVVTRAREAGLTRALCILAAGDEEESAAAARLRSLWPDVRFAVGVHPHQAGQFAGAVDVAVATVRLAVEAEGACAIGEIGLDYHYDFSPPAVQQEVFEAQVELAGELQLPVVIHTREATDDTFAVLERAGERRLRGVFHCFTGDVATARRALEIGFHVSLSGIVTFPRAAELREVAAMLPAERLLIETDAPYLLPRDLHPMPKGRRNEPRFLAHIANRIATFMNKSIEDVARATTENAERLFGLQAQGQRQLLL